MSAAGLAVHADSMLFLHLCLSLAGYDLRGRPKQFNVKDLRLTCPTAVVQLNQLLSGTVSRQHARKGSPQLAPPTTAVTSAAAAVACRGGCVDTPLHNAAPAAARLWAAHQAAQQQQRWQAAAPAPVRSATSGCPSDWGAPPSALYGIAPAAACQPEHSGHRYVSMTM